MTRTEMKGERKRTTTTKQNTSNSSYFLEEVTPQIQFRWAVNRLLFLRMRYLKLLRNLKKWFNRFFLCSGVKLEFLLTTGIN